MSSAYIHTVHPSPAGKDRRCFAIQPFERLRRGADGFARFHARLHRDGVDLGSKVRISATAPGVFNFNPGPNKLIAKLLGLQHPARYMLHFGFLNGCPAIDIASAVAVGTAPANAAAVGTAPANAAAVGTAPANAAALGTAPANGAALGTAPANAAALGTAPANAAAIGTAPANAAAVGTAPANAAALGTAPANAAALGTAPANAAALGTAPANGAALGTANAFDLGTVVDMRGRTAIYIFTKYRLCDLSMAAEILD
jgi:hypothetical protein